MSSEENLAPNHPHPSNQSVRKSARLTIQSDDEEDARGDASDSNISGTHSPQRNHDIFALRRTNASRHFDRSPDQGHKQNRRHSDRLSKRPIENRRPFYLDELEGSEVDEHFDHNTDYEERSLTAFQRYNLRDRKRTTLHHIDDHYSTSAPPRRRRHQPTSRYNLRPHRGTRISEEYQVPWSVADQYVFSKQPKRQMIPDKTLMEATPELQPYESHADVGSGQHDENTSTMANDEEIMAQTIQPQSNEPPFARIAGMQDYVKQLKEMVVFPLLYPSFFNRLGIAPPRGVLFHGPPGTGKTLMARLLAESCSSNSRKVSFFMRNGSDCLSKWIGEAERNMKLLFQKAKECQPSIIFFDEIDGLAPERSARADQSHISLVSTLLALMDGLDDRGNVVVIGATNRIHALDPALRRPGRFDREFYFGLPDERTRKDILKILTKSWEPVPCDEVLSKLAHTTHGFSGADLKGLCTEAALYAIRRIAPEAYESATALAESQFADRQIVVLNDDFYEAFRKIVPSTRRYDESERPAIPLPFSILTEPMVSSIVEMIRETVGEPIPCLEPSLHGNSTWTIQSNLLNFNSQLPASMSLRLFKMAAARIEGYKTITLNTHKLSEDSSISTQLFNGVFKEAKSMSPSILLIPDLTGFSHCEQIYDSIAAFVESLLPCEPILLITINDPGSDTVSLPEPSLDCAHQFIEYTICKEVYAVITAKLSKLETIFAFGKSIGVELGYLLVSPFPDYAAFIESLAIFPNHEKIMTAIQPLLPLGTIEWYKSLAETVKNEYKTDGHIDLDSLSTMRLSILRAVQASPIPTVENLKTSIMQAIK